MGKDLTLKTFETEIKDSKIPVLVDFNGSWCVPCKRFMKVLDEMKEDLKYKIKVCQVDLEKEAHLGEKYNILSLPTIIFFHEGKKVSQSEGALTATQLKKKIKELFNIEL